LRGPVERKLNGKGKTRGSRGSNGKLRGELNKKRRGEFNEFGSGSNRPENVAKNHGGAQGMGWRKGKPKSWGHRRPRT